MAGRQPAPPDEFDPYASPVNSVPAVIWIPAAAMALLEVAFQAGARGIIGGPQSVGWRVGAVENFGFFDTVFEHLRAHGWWEAEQLLRFVTYPFLHWTLTHALFGIVLLLALGNRVARVYTPVAVVSGLALASITGALVFGMVADTRQPMIGAVTMDYGLIGMLTVLLWLQARYEGQHPVKAFRLIIILSGLQVVFYLAALATGDQTIGLAQQIMPDTAAFLAGLAVGWLTFPGHLGRMLARMRNRA